MSKSIKYRIALSVFLGAAVFGVFLPYFNISEWFSVKLTGNQLLSFGQFEELVGDFDSDAQTGLIMIRVLILVPLIHAFISCLLTAISGKKVSVWISLFQGIIQIICYGLFLTMFILADASYFIGVGLWVQLILGIVIFCISICALVEVRKTKRGASTLTLNIHSGELLGVQGNYAGAKIPIDAKGVMIGRDASVCNIILDNEKVSRRHCEVLYDMEKDHYIVTDFSTNGVFRRDGSRIPSKQPIDFYKGEVICIGNGDNMFQFL